MSKPEVVNPRYSLRHQILVAAIRSQLGIRPRKLLAQSSPDMVWWR